jgi:hypothetical protein
MARYVVLVDDNFHYQDESERYEHGVYDTAADALAACRSIVDKCLQHEYQTSMTAEALYSQYVSFGNDPFIVVDGEGECVAFSAWDYAKECSEALCAREKSS